MDIWTRRLEPRRKKGMSISVVYSNLFKNLIHSKILHFSNRQLVCRAATSQFFVAQTLPDRRNLNNSINHQQFLRLILNGLDPSSVPTPAVSHKLPWVPAIQRPTLSTVKITAVETKCADLYIYKCP